ncbi:MAG: hypothetical protein AB8B55_24350 [Mariniblastus sp.]
MITSLLLLTGCGQVASVTGVVTGNGETVGGGDIIFRPVESGVKPAAGAIGADGSFALKTAGDSGLIPGEYTVLFTAPLPQEDAENLGPPSPWRSWKAPVDPVLVKAGANEFSIELVEAK